ncbi:MaoC/PaaZ C-terminal domain-containing protein [Marinobacter salicampi]|uniref:MaoC/PaaZ C-terminal domain-containing protein n=1 Tax=Marinobacter salicampi TaxID=435907 RepID=UPI00140BA73A|nr:MaoC/PaaZ C-terminal domain-containing protein [Marinobacter salicampi]
MDNSLYFEDLKTGEVFESTGRTVTETDMTMFSMLSGDWNPVHCDQEFASKTRYGERLVHGAYGIAIATGMMHTLGVFEKSAVAMMSISDWKFVKPITIGMTLRLKLSILDFEAGTSKRVGRVNRRLQLVNQHDEVVQDGVSDMLILKRSGIVES